MIDLTKLKIGDYWWSPITNKTYQVCTPSHICEGCAFTRTHECYYPKKTLGVDKFHCTYKIYKDVTMTKKDLKDGMLVKHRNGTIYMVLGNHLINKRGYNHLCLIENDLTANEDPKDWDIIEVYTSNESACDLEEALVLTKLIWKRNENKEMSVEEIEKALGIPSGTLRIKKNDLGGN